MKFLDQLFCNHTYLEKGKLNCTCDDLSKGMISCPLVFYECMKCKKRIVIKNDDSYYSKGMLHQVRLWEKRQIEINFDGEK